MWQLLLKILAAAALLYIAIGVLLYARQGSYIYFPERALRGTPDRAGLRYEDVRITDEEGSTLAAWFVTAATNGPALAPQPTVLFCHGNAGNIGDRLATLRTLADLGFDVLIFDYRGYGQSEGKPSEEATYLGAMAAWHYLTETRNVAPKNIVLYGRSLGGAVAAWLATKTEPGLLVLESTFASIPAMAARFYPIYPTRWLTRINYDTLSRMPLIRCPVIVAHSREDEMIPFEQGRALFEAAGEPKLFIELQSSHNAGGLDITPGYRDRLRQWATTGSIGDGESRADPDTSIRPDEPESEPSGRSTP